ncbi:helix-turn-helix transcriptional regulator [Dactylosporangium sp. NPDC049140]|uniref:helix-turn-helix domain-containing protein n=1 Tax=Dactylosporangium sp. NPDC049140 TaxID=3155647 RepID=UPI0033DA4A52
MKAPGSASRAEPATARPQVVWEMIGRQLRDFRNARDISRAEAGRHIGGDETKISRLELGRVKVKEEDLERLLDLYGVTSVAEQRAMLDLTRRAGSRQWWYQHRDLLADWFCSYLLLESAAHLIRTYEVQFIPGLLQTRAYAEAVMRLRYTDEAEVRRRVDVRMERQRILHEQRSTHVWAVVEEAALRQQIGGPHVMREQLKALVQANERRYIRIQVLPNSAGGHAGTGTSFSILRLRSEKLLDVVYLEQLESAQFFTDAWQSDPYFEAWSRLSVAAGKPDDTTAVFANLLRESIDGQKTMG